MEVGKLTVKRRHHTGKGIARKLRAQGRIPGVCYGIKLDAPVSIDVDTRELRASLDPVKRHNTVIDLTIEDDGQAPQNVVVMVREYQIHEIRRELTHVDLVAIDTDRTIEAEVPIEFTGKAPGLILGGQLHVVMHELHVRCKPADIPASVALDISELDIGDVLHVSDMTLPEGVESVALPTAAVMTCTAPVADVVETEGEEVGEEVAAAATDDSKDGKKEAKKED